MKTCVVSPMTVTFLSPTPDVSAAAALPCQTWRGSLVASAEDVRDPPMSMRRPLSGHSRTDISLVPPVLHGSGGIALSLSDVGWPCLWL